MFSLGLFPLFSFLSRCNFLCDCNFGNFPSRLCHFTCINICFRRFLLGHRTNIVVGRFQVIAWEIFAVLMLCKQASDLSRTYEFREEITNSKVMINKSVIRALRPSLNSTHLLSINYENTCIVVALQ